MSVRRPGQRRVAEILAAGAIGTDLTLSSALAANGISAISGAFSSGLTTGALDVGGESNFNGGVNFESAVAFNAEIQVNAERSESSVTPAALGAGNNNNYAGLAPGMHARFTPNGAGSTLTGIVAPLTPRSFFLWNIGAANLTIANQDVNSTLANRFLTTTGAGLVVTPDDLAFVWYDPSSSRWRAVLV